MGEQLYKVGDTVAVGRAIARIEAGGCGTSRAEGRSTADARRAIRQAAPEQPPVDKATAETPLSPSVRRVVEERGLDPATLPHSGPATASPRRTRSAAGTPHPEAVAAVLPRTPARKM